MNVLFRLRSGRRCRRRLGAFAVIVSAVTVPAAAQVSPPGTPALAAPVPAKRKTDVVELKNGDRITCEIRGLDRGKLTVKTDGIGTVSIEWDDVERLSSLFGYDVEVASGLRLFGALSRGDPLTVGVMTTAGEQRLSLDNIVRITPLGRTFWQRLDGGIDAGFSFAQANVQTDWTLHSTVSYRGRKWLTQVTGDSAVTTREDAESQTRNTLTLRTEQFLGARWSALGLVQVQQNRQLALDLRAALGAALGRILFQSNRTVLSALGGAAFTSEQYSGAEVDRVGEAVAGLTWAWFTFDGRSTNFSLDALSYYALNGDARTRLELSSSFKSDIVGDLYWSINLVESYNGNPPSGERRNDAVFSAAIGWTFRADGRWSLPESTGTGLTMPRVVSRAVAPV